MNIPKNYIPESLSKKDRQKQLKNLVASQKNYKKGIFKTRPSLDSFNAKKSFHIRNAKNTYNINSIKPSKALADKTGCNLATLNKIVEKGKGAYFSSGSRPNQTPESWGIARLASAITAGKASQIDYNLLKSGCDKNSTALILATRKRKQQQYGKGIFTPISHLII